jgi:hypothetical protein
VKRLYYLFYGTLLIFLFLAEFFHPITAINVDLGRHLLLGKIIVATHHVPHTNLLSYSYPNFPYINSSWLTEVVYYLLFATGGFTLLLFINTLIIAIAFGLLVYKAIKKNGLTLATLFSITLYLLLLGLRCDIRPEVMSMVCLSLFMFFLYQVREGKNKTLLFFLIPIELVWVNLHIYFFVGPLLLLLFLLDHLVTHRFIFAYAKVYLVSLAGTLIVTLINPNGINGAEFPFMVLNNYGLPVIENQSIPTLFALYHSPEIILPLIAIVILFSLLILARKNTELLDWFLAIVFSLAALFIFRNIVLFVFATFIPFSKQLNYLVTKYHPLFKKTPSILTSFLYVLSITFLLLFITESISTNGFGFGVRATGEKAADFLINNKIPGPFYNNFDIGDYLAYRFYPQRVFVENRPEAYPANFFQNFYLPMQNNPEIFDEIAREYRFNAVVISYWDNTPWGNTLLHYLVIHSQYKLVYLDSYTIILLADTPANHTVISQNLITEKRLQLKLYQDPQERIHYLFFFEKVGWIKEVDFMMSLIRKTDPQLCSLRQYPLEHSSIARYIQENRINNCSGNMINL